MFEKNLSARLPILCGVFVGLARRRLSFHRCVIPVLVALLIGSGFPAAHAATDPTFVEVAINGQTADEQTAAFEVGLRMVLLRLAQANKPLSAAAVRRAEANAASYVQKHELRVPGADDTITRQTPLTQLVRDTGQATHLISIQFSRESINQLIQSEAEAKEDGDEIDPVVDARSALVWLLIEDGNQSVIVGGSTARNIMDRAREIGGGVGQQLQFPARDDAALQQLTVEDLRNVNSPKIAALSERFLEPVILVGTLTRARGRTWNARWNRIQGETQTAMTFDTNSLDKALQGGIQWLAGAPTGLSTESNTLAARSAAPVSEGLIWIGSVVDVGAYSRLVGLIDDMEGATVYLKSMLRDSLVVAVTPRAAVNDVARILINSNRVVSVGSAPAVAGGLRPDVALQYTR